MIVPYVYDAKKLQDHLAFSMPKEQVLKQLGKPDRVVRDDGKQTIWEYRLYPTGEWTGYLIHCPLFPNCYFPAEGGDSYYVVLNDNQLCMWGTRDVVLSLVGMVCGTAVSQQQVRGELRMSVLPVFMPPPISPLPKRLAIVPANGSIDNEINSWLDLTFNFLRTRHRELVLVEREDLRTVLHEVEMQYSGSVDDETTIHLGRLVGADSLLTYRLLVADENRSIAAAFELRLFRVESGTTVFRQMASANRSAVAAVAAGSPLYRSELFVRRLVLEEAAAYGMAALTAAFGDNPLGLVSDYTWTGDGIKLIDVLQGGPASRAGLRPGDQILEWNGQLVASWADPVSLPAQLTIRRDGMPIVVIVR